MGASAEERILRRNWYPTLSVIGMGGIPSPEIAGNVLRPYTTAVTLVSAASDGRRVRHGKGTHADLDDRRSLAPRSRSRTSIQETGGCRPSWRRGSRPPWKKPRLTTLASPVGFTGEGGSIPFLGSLAKRYPGVQFVATGVDGPESNAHAIDEMLDLPMAVGVTNMVVTVLEAHATK